MKLWSYLFLPSEISAFERAYLRRMNRVALIFFYMHVPAFIAIAALAGTSMLQAAVMTPLVLIGPTIIYFWFKNPRAVAVACGFTAMVMGGLLVHFGQGAMQIEMHFYFFVLIALLAVFGNPAAILTAAATVAVHHLMVWLLFPKSVFNYEASVWTVVVHAVFVVLESVAAVFVARSFFDNVIGLEKIVAARTAELDQRTRDMRLVLENVGQGFVTLAPDGSMSAERSAILETWLGRAPQSGQFIDYVAEVDRDVATSFELGWGEVFGGIMPLELTLDQLPKRLEAGKRHLELNYRAIGTGDIPDAVLVVVSDITAELERERAEAERRELMAVFERVNTDRAGFIEFCDEAEELVRRIDTSRLGSVPGETDGNSNGNADLQRQLHTLKGNAALFGVESVSSYCHTLESRMIEDHTPPTPEERRELAGRWRTFLAKLDAVLGKRDERRIEVSDEDIGRVLGALRRNDPEEVHKLIQAWRLEPVARRFERVAEQANRLARRLGKSVQVEIDDKGVRLDPQRWAPFWANFVHAVRNAIDHGIEDAGERKQSGKPEVAKVGLSSSVADGALTIEIRDDGRGVDWDRVRERAQRLGLRGETRDDLVEALFADGLSTKDDVSDLSGRGVGLAALRAAATHEGGRVTVISEPQRGTCVRFDFPSA